jgi:uncharacterized protein YraI
MSRKWFRQISPDLSYSFTLALITALLLTACGTITEAPLQSALAIADEDDIQAPPANADSNLSLSRAFISYQSVPAQQTTTCAATSTEAVNIRTGPGQNYTIIGALQPNNYVQINGRNADASWFAVSIAGGQGWVFGAVVLLAGQCDGLPVLQATEATPVFLPQALPVAVNDENSSYFEVDHNSEGQFRQSISFPDGDRTDRILMVVSNMQNTPADQSRVFVVKLDCRGAGTEFVRWGASSNAMLTCGGSLVTNLTYEFNQQSFIVRLPEASGPSYIDYTLRALPVAPGDEEENPLGFSADRDSSSQMVDQISFPDGDRIDRVVMDVGNLSQSNLDYYRVFNLTLVCEGTGVEFVRWGTPDSPALGCGSTMPVFFSYGLNQQSFIITLPDNSSQSYISYSVRAAPVAQNDAQAFYLEVGRDGSKQVGDVVSFPDGDSSDLIQMAVVGLTAVSPDNYREFVLTVTCTGTGTEFLRWGAPENPTQGCNSSITVPFIYGFNRQLFVVTLPRDSGQSFVNYRLTANVLGGAS